MVWESLRSHQRLGLAEARDAYRLLVSAALGLRPSTP
jgi:hypothetical protein